MLVLTGNFAARCDDLRCSDNDDGLIQLVYSTCSGDSLMGVIGVDVRRCFPLLRLRWVLGFFWA
jgi:hypothetical protein